MTKDKFYYNYIDENSTAEFKDRGSKFIAFAYPITTTDEVKKHLLTLKKQHPKANHFCYAYSLGFDGNTYRVSDDGEPSGSAGKPIYNQLLSKELTNVLIVVVRYFGGTLLGVQGLVNAYKTAATLALQTVAIKQKPIELLYKIEFDYTLINEVMMVVKANNISLLQQEVQLFCVFTIGIAANSEAELIYKLSQIHGLTIQKIAA